jgi:DNA-binding beta-propeller fold protein YncE
MRKPLVLLALFALLVPAGLSAASFAVFASFDVSGFMDSGPEGIVYDTASGNLFVVSSSTPAVGDGNSIVHEITTSGVEVTNWLIPVEEAEGITLLTNGNLLFTNSTSGGAVSEFTTAGVAVPGPTGLDFLLHPPSDDADGIVFNTLTGTFFVVDDDKQTVFEFAADGSTNSEAFKTTDVAAAFTHPEGITVDPFTGNLLIVDNQYGSKSLYEVTTAGVLVSTLALGFDAEGVTIDPATRILYIADDNGGKIYLAAIPEPATSALIGIGLVALFGIRRYRTRRS